MTAELRLLALDGVPEISAGADLCAVIEAALEPSNTALMAGDVVVLAQKIVSKAEGRRMDLATVQVSERARELAAVVNKDPRLVELILSESIAVIRTRRDVLIVEHRLGLILANAGIDQSNVQADGKEYALLLPLDPDQSCATLRARLHARFGFDVPVLMIDSIGRAWRLGTVGHALGVSGLPALLDLRGRPDRSGRPLQTSELGMADELAAAASLVMGQADESRPIVIARGVPYARREGSVRELLRPHKLDLFR